MTLATVQHTATHCNTLHHTAPYCNTLQQTATHCNTLRHTATHSRPTNDTSYTAANNVLNQESTLRSTIFIASTQLVHTPRSDFPLHFDTQNTCQIRTQKFNDSARCLLPATLRECWPQVCHIQITFELLQTDLFVSAKTNSMKCFVSWIPVNEHLCPNKTNPALTCKFLSNINVLLQYKSLQ